jgi:type II secretory pathway component PulF
MAIIVTPKSLGQKAELYHQLGALTNAGVGLPQAIQTIQRSPPARSLLPVLTRLSQSLESGCTFTESLRQSRHEIPDFDLALIEASELSGRLDGGFQLLAEHYRGRASMMRAVISDFLYPVFVLHAAILIFPFAEAFLSGNWGSYAIRVLGPLGTIYATVFALLYVCQGRHGESWRAALERISRFIPVIRSARQAWALSRLSVALEALISAGVSIIQSWMLAANASGSPLLRQTVHGWNAALEGGRTPGELVTQSSEFPEMFASQYQTGEISGKLDQVLKRLHTYYLDEATRRTRLLAQWMPRMVYLGLMLVIAYRIVMFYTGYFNQLAPLL